MLGMSSAMGGDGTFIEVDDNFSELGLHAISLAAIRARRES